MKGLIIGALMVLISVIFFCIVLFTNLELAPHWLNTAVTIFMFVFWGTGMVIGRKAQKSLKDKA